ncbi:MAG: phosphoribosyltransferase family protein [Bacteroidota bacterium]|nr:phosphoribosyltransferase family protein [Bacteroidota bacterium]
MLLSDFIELIYPRQCLGCGNQLLKAEKYICLSCLNKMPKTNTHFEHDNNIIRKIAGKSEVLNASACYWFLKNSIVQNLIHNIKYKGFKNAAKEIGIIYGKELLKSDFYNNIDIIIPVPLHISKLRERGYNQSEYFAMGLSLSMGKKLVTNVLYRGYATETQTKKKIYDRWLNVKSNFIVKNSHLINGKHILLVDDVITSGSTLTSCSDTLFSIPETKVTIATIASTF